MSGPVGAARCSRPGWRRHRSGPAPSPPTTSRLLKDEPDPGAAVDFEALAGDDAVVRVRGRAVHLLIADPYHESRLTNAAVEKRLGVATNRNLTVLRAIAAEVVLTHPRPPAAVTRGYPALARGCRGAGVRSNPR